MRRLLQHLETKGPVVLVEKGPTRLRVLCDLADFPGYWSRRVYLYRHKPRVVVVVHIIWSGLVWSWGNNNVKW